MPADELDKLQKKLYAWVFGALLASVGLNQGIQSQFVNRGDAFTGAQGVALTRRIENSEKLLIQHELRLDTIQVFTGSAADKMRNYVASEFKEEKKECAKYRRDIAKRLYKFEFLQEQVVETLKHYGINLTIHGDKK